MKTYTAVESRVQLEMCKTWMGNYPELAASSIKKFRNQYRNMHIACVVEKSRVVFTATNEPNDNHEVFI